MRAAGQQILPTLSRGTLPAAGPSWEFRTDFLGGLNRLLLVSYLQLPSIVAIAFAISASSCIPDTHGSRLGANTTVFTCFRDFELEHRLAFQGIGRFRQRENDSGAPGEIRTPDLLLRRQSLYPAELRARTFNYSLSPWPHGKRGATQPGLAAIRCWPSPPPAHCGCGKISCARPTPWSRAGRRSSPPRWRPQFLPA